jgi:hypothetical protein
LVRALILVESPPRERPSTLARLPFRGQHSVWIIVASAICSAVSHAPLPATGSRMTPEARRRCCRKA